MIAMPIKVSTIKNTGALALIHYCEDCGAYACFGMGVSLRKALNLSVNGKIEAAKELLGKWYCLTHWRQLNESN